MNYSSDQLKEMYKKLPTRVQQAIFSDETAKTMQAIGTQFALHIDQVGIVADEAGLVMLGVTPRSQFAQMITKRAHLNPDIASKIAGEVESRVFKPIQEHLKGEATSDESVEILPSPEIGTALTPKPLTITPPPAALTSPVAPTLIPPNPPAIAPSLEPMAIPPAPPSEPAKNEGSPFLPPPDTAPAPATPSTTSAGIVGSKLGTVTYGAPQNPPLEAPKNSAPTYTADPYREPIN